MRASLFLNVLYGKRIDSDVKKFLNATGISDPRIVGALDFLAKNLKIKGLWNKMDVIYPFVGGTQATHAFNLKNPSAFKLAQSGTVTNNSNGVTGDGSTGYLSSGYVIPAGYQDSFSMGVYTRNNVQGNFCAMGICTNTSSAFTQLYLRQSGAGNALSADINQNAGTNTFNNSNSQGFYAGVRTASNVVAAYKNGTSVATDTDASVTPSTGVLDILARNSTPPGVRGSFATYNLAYAFIGQGLTATEVALYYPIVQQFQALLSRQV